MFKRVNRKCAPLPVVCALFFSLALYVYFGVFAASISNAHREQSTDQTGVL